MLSVQLVYSRCSPRGRNALHQFLRVGAHVALPGALLVACGAPEAQVHRVNADQQVPATSAENRVKATQVPLNQRFATLDEYLAFLERTQAPVDGPWYREIRPGVYELQTGNLKLDVGDPKRVFTREELEQKFGFVP